ncbi:hypothetical protein MSG28_009853 [Choristoneura fumiferana]|uniref:Uncharacterized protein n=1 Tax=Choristoneura fumiferana TaxID=7141 RepID=A0ACC0JCT2_CHOFU|nr:hypothetical protein MSG28_009853 [Choristoneura fumiferana]
MADDVIKHSVHTLVFRSLKRSHDMFLANQGMLPPIDETAQMFITVFKIIINLLIVSAPPTHSSLPVTLSIGSGGMVSSC